MVEIINGKLTGSVEVPVSDLSLYGLFRYSDLSQYTTAEIAEAVGTTVHKINEAIKSVEKHDGKRILHQKQHHGRPKGQGNRKVVINDSDSDITKKIKTHFLFSKKSIEDFSKGVGVSSSAVNSWLFNGKVPSPASLNKLAKYCNTTEAWFLGYTKQAMRRF